MSEGLQETLTIGKREPFIVKLIQSNDQFNFAGLLMIKIFVFVWVFGIVLAKGGWSTFFAIIFPPYDLYLFIEYWLKVLQLPLQ